MKKFTVVMILLMCTGSLTWAGTYTDDTYGFVIESPGFEKLKTMEGAVTVVQFLAPPSLDFSANINVQIQNTGLSKEEYITTTREQMTTIGFEVLDEKEGVKDGFPFVMWEHKGTMSNFELHWLAMAVFRPGHVLLITGTSLESDFQKNKLLFLDSFNSLRLRKLPEPEDHPADTLKLE